MSLVRKLLLKPGMKLGIFNAPPQYQGLLGELPEGVSVAEEAAPGSLDSLHLFVASVAELERWAPEVLPLIKHDGLLWIAYPKKSGKLKSDITRDTGWDLLTKRGLRPISQVAIDDTWSALRFRPIDRVGT